jgi:hypothetical protein
MTLYEIYVDAPFPAGTLARGPLMANLTAGYVAPNATTNFDLLIPPDSANFRVTGAVAVVPEPSGYPFLSLGIIGILLELSRTTIPFRK